MYVPLPYGTKIYEIYFRLTTEVVLGNVFFFFLSHCGNFIVHHTRALKDKYLGERLSSGLFISVLVLVFVVSNSLPELHEMIHKTA